MKYDVALAIGMVSYSSEKNELVRSILRIPTTVKFRFLMGDTFVPKYADELSVPNASDGQSNFMPCTCFRKLQWWISYASTNWPEALYIGKTEDDTFIHFEKLLYDLLRPEVLRQKYLMYGLINSCMDGYKFTGDFEVSEKHLRGGPFSTGPMNVFSQKLAKKMTCVNCNNDIFDTPNMKKGFRCATRTKQRETCDCSIEYVLHTCVKQKIAVAHMTWTKGHWFMVHPGGMGWVNPGPETVFAHGTFMKKISRYHWEYAKNYSDTTNITYFPPLMWNVNTGKKNDGSQHMNPVALNPDVIKWYRKKCSGVPTRNLSVLKGRSLSWFGYGCHTSRLHDIPEYKIKTI